MNIFKSYIVPASKKNKNKNEKNEKKAEKQSVSPVPPNSTTPGSLNVTPGRTPMVSRPSSIYPQGDFRNSNRESILDIKSDVMVSWLYQQQLERLWANGIPGEGVVLKKFKDNYTCCPTELRNEEDSLFHQVVAMNVRCAMTVNTRVIKLFLSRHTADYVPLPDGLRLQVLPSIHHLPRCQKHHFGAFIQDQQILVVWDDQPKLLLSRAEHIEKSLMEMIWSDNGDSEYMDEKRSAQVSTVDLGPISDEDSGADIESTPAQRRPLRLINAMLISLTLCILVAALGSGWSRLAQEVSIDQNYIRLALLVFVPAQIFVSLFFFQVIIGNLSQMFGPISQVNVNSKFYSGKPSRRLDRNVVQLPHVTIQMPVYKEGLKAVIEPTIISLKAAISTYELQGGTANIFVNDDGMQLISEDEASERRDFYEEHSIGWVARPAHNPKPENEGEKAFLRRGKFKKASNMNFALMVSNKVEDRLLTIERPQGWTPEDEYHAYEDCLAAVLEEEEGRAWAAGNIRVGDYILLIDSDTRVPVDCLLDACSEMEQCPEVGILQCSSGVMQVTDSFFENGVTFFTNLIYTAIKYTVANGDVSPFVGHNAILRWSAVQGISYEDEDGYEKFWSESHVSEDFDMALRLQINGYIIRLAAYFGDGFKEGVSLTVYDELARWEKYAYGCNELLFHPFRFWVTRGPITPLFRRFLWADIPITSRITITAYIGTYYAIGAAFPLTLANYFLFGWFTGHLDKYYLDSFKVYISLIVVFTALGNVSLAIFRYRMSERSLIGAAFENFKWILLFNVFLGGISLHVSQALLSHFFEIDLQWGATAKEVENTTFFEEMPKLLKKFKFTFILCIVCTGVMIAGRFAFPVFWRITDFAAIYPLATVVFSHFMLPVALNPALMMFTW